MGNRGREQLFLWLVIASVFAATLILLSVRLAPIFHAVGRGLAG